jgi:hypothetical protein
MLEVMMALVVLSVGILSTFSAIGSAQQANTLTQTRHRVMGEIEKVVEKIQAAAVIYSSSSSQVTDPLTQGFVPVTSTSTTQPSSYDLVNGSIKQLTPVPGETYMLTVRRKTGLNPAPPAGVIPLVITVRWRQDNSNLSTTYDYYYAPRP